MPLASWTRWYCATHVWPFRSKLTEPDAPCTASIGTVRLPAIDVSNARSESRPFAMYAAPMFSPSAFVYAGSIIIPYPEPLVPRLRTGWVICVAS